MTFSTLSDGNGALRLRDDNPAWKAIAAALNDALKEKAMTVSFSYATAYPVRHHPNQRAGERSIYNSYLFALVDELEYVQDLIHNANEAEPRDTDDERAAAHLQCEYETHRLFEDWLAY